ncbi:hypothetical protein EVAR_20193_1 [Eumeta japonica]|uniref:Uncharacterized protein n=1 Tax=Eumeta variegata TaxID=151549 RepID=A0A4C1UVP0_EUMVA|nr:hypothetical protein EVAR_20193_1 [Eumeta japonica]
MYEHLLIFQRLDASSRRCQNRKQSLARVITKYDGARRGIATWHPMAISKDSYNAIFLLQYYQFRVRTGYTKHLNERGFIESASPPHSFPTSERLFQSFAAEREISFQFYLAFPSPGGESSRNFQG